MAAVSSVWPSPFAPNACTDVPVHTARATVPKPAQRIQKRTIASVVFTVMLLSRALPLLPGYVEYTMDGSCTGASSTCCQLLAERTPGPRLGANSALPRWRGPGMNLSQMGLSGVQCYAGLQRLINGSHTQPF